MFEENFVEDCWFLYGVRLGSIYLGFLKYHSEGTAGSVDFDFQKAMSSPFLLGWYHTHPGSGFLTPSSMDDRTMRSWIKGRARPMLCGIVCAGLQRCYCYYKDGMDDNKETVISRSIVAVRFMSPVFLGKRTKLLL
jgi:hypothetical protein